jgi:hypothetical protein
VFCQLQTLALRFKLNDNSNIFTKTHEVCRHLLHVSVPFCVEDERNCPRKKECEPGSKCHQQCVTLANGTDACSCHTGYTINSDGYRYVTWILHYLMLQCMWHHKFHFLGCRFVNHSEEMHLSLPLTPFHFVNVQCSNQHRSTMKHKEGEYHASVECNTH